MSRIAFHLKRHNVDTPQRVFALYHVGGRQVKLYTSISVRPKDWSTTRQRVKASSFNAAPINDQLSEIARSIEKIAFRLEQDGELTPERLKHDYQSSTNSSPTAKRSLLKHVEVWIAQAKRQHRPLTIRNYHTFENHLKNFCKTRSFEPTLSAIDKVFIDDFAEYLTEEVKLVNTSRWNQLKTFKTFLRWAYDNNQTTVRVFEKVKKKSYHVIEPPIIRLQEGELRAIAELDLSGDPSMENARDLFLLQCSVGVRYSDLIKINSSHVDGNYVRITTEKNRKAIAIPLLPTARQIIERQKPPYLISNQKLNQYLKDIAERAGITSPVTIPTFKGTQRKDITYSKHELITTHTAKRTFVSLMVARRVTVDTLMKITGNTRSTIERYISLDETDVNADVSKVKDLLL